MHLYAKSKERHTEAALWASLYARVKRPAIARLLIDTLTDDERISTRRALFLQTLCTLDRQDRRRALIHRIGRALLKAVHALAQIRPYAHRAVNPAAGSIERQAELLAQNPQFLARLAEQLRRQATYAEPSVTGAPGAEPNTSRRAA